MVAGPAHQGIHAPTPLRPSILSSGGMSQGGPTPPPPTEAAQTVGPPPPPPPPPHAMMGVPPSTMGMTPPSLGMTPPAVGGLTPNPTSLGMPPTTLGINPTSLGMSMGMGMALGGGVGIRGSEPPVKRKRGRPRKYTGPDMGGAALAAASGSSPVSMQLALQTSGGVGGTASPQTPATEKRGRGRPPGSGTKKLHSPSLGAGPSIAGSSAGLSFTPHVITIAAGEDVANKIMSFAQHGPRAVCVMSANGAISTVTLRQQSSSGGNVTYEGRYEILSLMGSFLPTDAGGGRQRTGGLSVSLACSDGRVIGGGVAGLLMAASPIQVVVGTFLSDTGKSVAKAGNGQEASIGLSPAAPTAGVAPTASTPTTVKTEQKVTPAPAGHQQSVTVQSVNNQPSGQPNQQLMGLFHQPMAAGWAANPALGEARRADINITLPGG